MRPESFWFQETGTVASVAKKASRYPYTVRFDAINYAGINTNNYAEDELIEVEKPPAKAKGKAKAKAAPKAKAKAKSDGASRAGDAKMSVVDGEVRRIHQDAFAGRREALACAMACAMAMLAPDAAFAGDKKAGAAVFSTNCAACHAGGQNVIVAEKTLEKDALEEYLDGGLSEASIKTQVTNGKNAMPAFEEKLKPEDIDNVAAYVYDMASKWSAD